MNTPSVPNTPLAEYPLPQWTSVTPSSAMEVRPAKGGLVASNSAISTATQSCPKRQIRACDFCHKRKTKCDGGHPCDHCSRLNVSCVYSRTEKRRGPRGGYTEGLQRRVHELTLILEERGIEYGTLFAYDYSVIYFRSSTLLLRSSRTAEHLAERYLYKRIDPSIAGCWFHSRTASTLDRLLLWLHRTHMPSSASEMVHVHIGAHQSTSAVLYECDLLGFNTIRSRSR